MNIKLICLFIVVFILNSCEKKYKYVEREIKGSILGGIETIEKEEEIIAKTDSSAYLLAFQKFKISEKINRQMRSTHFRYAPITESFILYDKDGNNITYISFPSKEKEEAEIIRILSKVKSTFSY